MQRSQFLKNLSGTAQRQILDKVFSGYTASAEVFTSLACDYFDAANFHLFLNLIDLEDFQQFLASRVKGSPERFESLSAQILKRAASGIKAEKLALLSHGMISGDFRMVERSFYFKPIDKTGCKLFEDGFITIAESNPVYLSDYYQLCLSEEFALFRREYGRGDLRKDIFPRLVELLLSRISLPALRQLLAYLCNPVMVDFLKVAEEHKASYGFLRKLFQVFNQHKDPGLFIRGLEVIASYYKKRPEAGYFFLMLSWKWLCRLSQQEQIKNLRRFLRLFGKTQDPLASMLRKAIFEMELDYIDKAMVFFISDAFASVLARYGSNESVLILLVKNLINLLMETEIRDLNLGLFPVILKLLVEQRVDTQFLKRRAEFFSWLKENSSSFLLELEIIRFILFEYVFLAIRKVPLKVPLEMTSFCDLEHKRFCILIDQQYTQVKLGRSELEKDDLFFIELMALRELIWGPAMEKFKNFAVQIQELRSIAESLDIEDLIIGALEEIEVEELPFYWTALIDVFRNFPQDIKEACAPDYWYRLRLERALPQIQAAVFPLIGNIPIKEGGEVACTDGSEILLPSYINYFKDSLSELKKNRNLTVYIGLGLHESGHIIGGSFAFDLGPFMYHLEKPELFQFLCNLFDDFRVEKFLVRIKAHPQVEEILFTLNEFMIYDYLSQPPNHVFHLLTSMSHEASGANARLKDLPEYQKRYEEALAVLKLPCGRFRNLQALLEYGTTRLQNLDILNPLSIMPLAREFYEILKNWNDDFLEGLLQHYQQKREPSMIGGNNPDYRPMTDKELESLYQEYDNEPEKFLEKHELPIMQREAAKEKSEGESDPQDEMRRAMAEQSKANQEFFAKDQFDYSKPGTIDFSRRTKLDDMSRKSQSQRQKRKGRFRKSKKKKTKGNKKRIYSIDPKTGSRTRLTEIEEFPVSSIDHDFMADFSKWNAISERVLEYLRMLIPQNQLEYESSEIEGEINMGRLLEILGSRDYSQSLDFLEMHNEVQQSREIEIVIGLDVSGSTAAEVSENTTILDVEKAFALIFGRALQQLSKGLTVLAFNSVMSTTVFKIEPLEAVSSLQSDWGNRDGDFIRYVTDLLVKKTAEVKYFFLITDGCPNSDNYEGHDGLQDTIIAMRECKKAGIQLIYLNIDIILSDYFIMFQKEANYAEHFSHPEEILTRIPDLVRAVLESMY